MIVLLIRGMKTEAIFATSDPDNVMSRSFGLMSILHFYTDTFGASSEAGVPGWVDASNSKSKFIFLILTSISPLTVINDHL